MAYASWNKFRIILLVYVNTHVPEGAVQERKEVCKVGFYILHYPESVIYRVRVDNPLNRSYIKVSIEQIYFTSQGPC
jgi:hypothetical protein